MMQSRRLAALAAAMVIGVAACGGSDDGATETTSGGDTTVAVETTAVVDTTAPAETTAPPTTDGGGEPVAGGEITVGRRASLFGWLGDYSLNGAMFQTLNMVYGNLITLDETGTELVPGLAESFEFDPAAPSISLTLRPGLVFSDGSELTSADVAFSAEQWMAGPINGGIFADIAAVQTPDDLTVVLELSRPNVYVLNALATALAPVYPQDWGGVPQADFEVAPIGAGPYTLADWSNPGPDETVVLERNESYWDTGKPYLDRITYRSFSDANQMVLAYQAGDLDAVENVPAALVDQIPEEERRVLGDGPIALLLLNTTRPGLDNVDLRQAISLAIDREGLTALYGGFATAAAGVLPVNPSDYGAPTEGHTYDPDAARALLEQVPGAADLTFEMLHGPDDGEVAQAIAAMLGDIGLNVTTASVDSGTLFDRGGQGDYDMQINFNAAWPPTVLDPIVATQVIGWYYTGMDPSIGSAEIEAALAESDPAARAALVTSIQDQLLEAGGKQGIVTLQLVFAANSRVQGWSLWPTGNWNSAAVYVTE
jgi:ABC-type transport system substrate-binding protein